MTKRMILMLVLVALVLGGIFGYKIFAGMMMKKYMSAGGIPAQTVSTTKATYQDWQPKLEAVGSLRAINGADLSAEVPGIVEEIKFESGSDVESGTLLVQLRAEDDLAHLLSLQAALRLAEITYARDLKQIKAQAISQATVDADAANMTGLRAQVVEQQAVVDKKTVRAPFAGHLGIRQVDIGQYLNSGTTIVTLQQLDPIYVDFTMPEEALTQIKLGQTITLTTDALAGKSFDGEISSINSKIDESTRNVSVRATLKNPDHALLPGMFAKVVIASGEAQRYITLPQTAITYNPYGNTVYLVESPDEKEGSDEKEGGGKGSTLIAHQSFVTTGGTRGDQIAVLSGVKEGDTVITAGQIKLRNGAPIVVNNDVKPTDDANPEPKDQ
jgi:membrane fusion protein (multidrug efflux system)